MGTGAAHHNWYQSLDTSGRFCIAPGISESILFFSVCQV